MANKLIKHMALAHSGVYAYGREELPSLGVYDIPDEYAGQAVFNVYRPATLLAARAGMFTRLPVTFEHPDRLLDPSTVKEHTIGFTGDSTEPVFNSQTGEVFLISSMTLTTDEAIAAYDSDMREVSPGYIPTIKWGKGVHQGEDYQLVMTDIKDVNHLAITRKARGGSSTCIFDSVEGGGIMKSKVLTGLWRFLRKKAKGTVDTDLGAARNILMDIAANKGTLSDEEIAGKIGEVQQMANDLPESEDRGMLMRLLEDFKQSKQMDDAAVNEAAEMISTLFEKLDTSAMSEITGVIPTDSKPLEGDKPMAETGDGVVGQSQLADPGTYVPGVAPSVGQDSFTDEDVQSMLAGLKGKKISPDQAMYILQEILAAGKSGGTSAATDGEKPPAGDQPAATDGEKPPAGDKPAAAADSTEPPAGDKPAATDSTEPPAGDQPAATDGEKPPAGDQPAAVDSTEPPVAATDSITATLDDSSSGSTGGLKEFFGTNFGIR